MGDSRDDYYFASVQLLDEKSSVLDAWSDGAASALRAISPTAGEVSVQHTFVPAAHGYASDPNAPLDERWPRYVYLLQYRHWCRVCPSIGVEDGSVERLVFCA